MQAIFASILLITMMVVSYRVGKRKGYSGLLFVFLTTLCPIMPIIALILPDKSRSRAEVAAQRRKMDEMNARIRELERQQQKPKPAEKKAPAEKTADAYTQGMQFYREKEYFKAYPLLEKAAQQGRVNAQYTLGIMHRYSQGCKLDEEEALRWLETAGERGHLEAQKACASMYTVEKRDTKKALYWHEKAAEQGDAESQYAVAFYNRDNEEVARYWAEKAAAQGNEKARKLLQEYAPEEQADPKPAQRKPEPKPESALNRENITAELVELHHFALKSYNKKEYFRALEWFEKVAKAGHTEAQLYCAQMYYRGQGCEVDYEKAFYWSEQAAAQGSRSAQSNLAVMYREGKGCSVDLKKSLYWYEKAAEQGDDNAQFWAGMMYELGQGCTEDAEKARYWYEKAAAQGNEKAQKLLVK